MTGPNPVDRGKMGSKIHVLSDRAGLPLSVAVSAANTNDAYALKPLVMAIPAIKSRRGPRRRKPHADKAYDQVELRAWVRDRGIAVRIARKGIESSQKLGKHRWVIERTIAWLFGYHRLSIRYERYANHLRLPHPRCRIDLLQEAGQTNHMRHALNLIDITAATPPLPQPSLRPAHKRSCLSRSQAISRGHPGF